MRYIFNTLLVSSCLFVSACQTMPSNQAPLNQPMTWQDRATQLKKTDHWKITGKLGGQALTEQKTQNISATVVWEQNHNSYDIHIFGPLGENMIKIAGGPQNTSLITYSQDEYIDHDPQHLLKEKTGMDFPVTAFYYWVRGLPAPQSPAKLQFDAYHHLTALEQDGFKVQYLHYTAVNNTIDLPSLMSISGKNLTVRINIRDWYIYS